MARSASPPTQRTQLRCALSSAHLASARMSLKVPGRSTWPSPGSVLSEGLRMGHQGHRSLPSERRTRHPSSVPSPATLGAGPAGISPEPLPPYGPRPHSSPSTRPSTIFVCGAGQGGVLPARQCGECRISGLGGCGEMSPTQCPRVRLQPVGGRGAKRKHTDAPSRARAGCEIPDFLVYSIF